MWICAVRRRCCIRKCIAPGVFFFFFSSRRRHTRSLCDWSSDVCSSDLRLAGDSWRSRPRIASKSKLSIARLWRRVAKTMVRLVCARTTTRTTMQLSSLVRTGTTSKWFATDPGPDPSIEASAKDAPMSQRHKASFAMYLLVILGLYGFGLRYLFKSELTGYHALALGQSLSARSPSYQIAFLTSYRVDAAGILSM